MNERLKSLSQDALALPPEDRAALLETLWDSLVEHAGNVPVPDWHGGVIEARRAQHRADPGAASPWREALQRVEGRRKSS